MSTVGCPRMTCFLGCCCAEGRSGPHSLFWRDPTPSSCELCVTLDSGEILSIPVPVPSARYDPEVNPQWTHHPAIVVIELEVVATQV